MTRRHGEKSAYGDEVLALGGDFGADDGLDLVFPLVDDRLDVVLAPHLDGPLHDDLALDDGLVLHHVGRPVQHRSETGSPRGASAKGQAGAGETVTVVVAVMLEGLVLVLEGLALLLGQVPVVVVAHEASASGREHGRGRGASQGRRIEGRRAERGRTKRGRGVGEDGSGVGGGVDEVRHHDG